MSLVNLKRIARYKVRRTEVGFDEFEDFLKQWWSSKFNLPKNHPLLLEMTLEDLVVDYYTDLFAKDAKELEKFELEIGEVSKDSEEEWFKKEMGKEYTDKEAYSREYMEENEIKSEDDKKEESVTESKGKNEFNDVY